ncbi:MAG TPA: YajG family lipoprotein, partial [Steroidobacteraceae bacterium]|nr:YajG family lipoprotein [Steroidobacteraceae bacterium]
DAPVSLTVEVRALNYETSTGFWTGGVEIKSALKAVGLRGGKAFEQMYRSDNEKRVVVVPTAGKNEEWINAALTDVLTQLFNDQGLFRHLTGG